MWRAFAAIGATIFCVLWTVGAAGRAEADTPPAVAENAYHSPYSLEFSEPVESLTGDLLKGPLGDPKLQSSVSYEEWYSPAIQKKYGAWGPPFKRYTLPAELAAKPAQWKRERVIAVASHFIGCTYQHHHLPVWNPPPGWPWKEVGHGSNAPGTDCSNFSGLVYNFALGVRMSTDVSEQAAEKEAKINGQRDGTVPLVTVPKPDDYDQLVAQLRTGDLLYILNNKKEVSHVIIWVGKVGRSPDGVPLVIDSTGSQHRDSNGTQIPDGVQLRPFTRKSWYFHSLSHIHRLIPDDPQPPAASR